MNRSFDIYYTSDTHGKILPVDYQSGRHLTRGLMDIAACIKHTGNTIIADGGDSLQGSPLMQYYLEHSSEYAVHPAAFAFNAMGLDVYTLGNHDFNFGYDVLAAYTQAVDAVCVCANVEDRHGELKLRKTWIKTLENGLRLGFTGVVTDYVNLWEKPEHLTELVVSEPVAAAQKALSELKDKCDICICIYHGGYERELETGALLTDSKENVACRLADETDFDILLTGHQHMPVAGTVISDTYSAQPPCDAGSYIHMECTVSDCESSGGSCHTSDSAAANASDFTGAADAAGSVGVASSVGAADSKENSAIVAASASADKASRSDDACHSDVFSLSSGLVIRSALIPVDKDCDSSAYACLMPLEQATESWLDETIGQLSAAIEPEEKLDVALHGSRLADFFNEVMQDALHADIACSSLSNNPTGLPESISIRSVYAAYMFANTLTVKEVTKAVIRECLERCAMYLELDSDGQPYIGDTFLKPKIEHYNYDIYSGLDYAFDLTKPYGERVVRLRLLDGTELDDTAVYTLVTSDYRATGTGGYEALGACRTVFSGADNMQDMIVDYIRSHNPLTIPHNNRFSVIY